VRKPYLAAGIFLITSSFTSAPLNINSHPGHLASTIIVGAKATEGSTLYQTMHLGDYGLSQKAFETAWKGYSSLAEKKQLIRTDFLTICDFSLSSREKRFFTIDIIQEKLVAHTYVAHGKNSGDEFARSFSNEPESLQSSLGFYLTASTYTGSHGLSLQLKGLETGFNDRALERNIVIHGATYVDASRAKAGIPMGHSWGCPALPAAEATSIINKIKNGTCFFIYHPDKNYITHSKILND
jgi:hypothetical protein